MLPREFDEPDDVALGMRAAGEVDPAFLELVPRPRDVRGDRVAAGVGERLEMLRPVTLRNPEVVDLAGVEEGVFPVQGERVRADLTGWLGRLAMLHGHFPFLWFK